MGIIENKAKIEELNELIDTTERQLKERREQREHYKCLARARKKKLLAMDERIHQLLDNKWLYLSKIKMLDRENERLAKSNNNEQATALLPDVSGCSLPDSTELIELAHRHNDVVEHQGYDWTSFFNGYILGFFDYHKKFK
jgi:hypothetical protein